MDKNENRALIVGCGDVGLRVAARWRAQGGEVTGVVRTPQSAARLRAAGIEACTLNLDETAPPAAQTVFWFAPPLREGDTDPRLRRWLARTDAARVVYISTSGVYGDCNGRWIDEDAPLKPQTPRARRRVDAETALQEWRGPGRAAVILRVPGIYGPGRLPAERLRAGTPIVVDAESPYSNRIHSEDLADAAVAAMQRGADGAAYNISDGSPTTMSDYFRRCAALLHLPAPPEVTLDEARRSLSPMTLSFLEESKRLHNARARRELGWAPRYPDLSAGLPACLHPKEH